MANARARQFRKRPTIATHKQSGKQITKGEFRYEAPSDSYRCQAGHSLRRSAVRRLPDRRIPS